MPNSFGAEAEVYYDHSMLNAHTNGLYGNSFLLSYRTQIYGHNQAESGEWVLSDAIPKKRQVIPLSWGVRPQRAAHLFKVGPILSYIITATDPFRNEPKCSSPVKAIPK